MRRVVLTLDLDLRCGMIVTEIIEMEKLGGKRQVEAHAFKWFGSGVDEVWTWAGRGR